MTKKLVKNGLHSRISHPKLTKVQAEVLDMILNEYMSASQIASRRETTRQNINQIIKKIQKKGLLNPLDRNGLQKATHVNQKGSVWSYHGLHFVVRPYYFYPRYFRNVSVVGVSYGDWVFKLHKDVVEVQSKSLVEFTDKDKFKAISKAEVSFNKALVQASSRFGFEVFKEGKGNVRLVNDHLEFQNSPVARASGESYIRIRNSEGKTWFMIDMSRGGLNHEYLGSVVSNSEFLEPFFNDVKSGGWEAMKDASRVFSDAARSYARNIELHLSVMRDMRKTLRDIRKEIKNLKGGKDEV